MCSVTESLGGGVPTLVSEYSDPRICFLLSQSYYFRPTYPLLPLLDLIMREIPSPVLSVETTCHAFVRYHPPT